jgi:hypothetical protein
VRKCLKHERYGEACVSLEEASTSAADEPSGRLEWVVARAFNKGYDDTAQFSADVERTWEKLEKKWSAGGEAKKLEALEVVRAYFERKWQSLGIGSNGALVCVPSVGISKEELEVPAHPTASERSFASTMMTTAQTSTDPLASDSDTQTRLTQRETECKSDELERCKCVIQNFMKTPEALHFRGPVDVRTVNVTNHSKLVKQPMDFTSILSKIDAGEIADANSVWDACCLIWFNCLAVYPPNSEMIRICKRAELMFAAAWRAEGLMIIQPVPTEMKASPANETDAQPTNAVGSKQKSEALSTATSTVPQKTKRVAAYKCDVCKRSKKGRCGTESAPKSCLGRPENQMHERQAAIRQRLSKLKPMPERKKPDKSMKDKPIKAPAEKKPKGTKRKMTEAELQEDGFRRIFDVDDPGNFMTRMEDQQQVAQTSAQWDSASYHLVNEQIRLQQLQQRMLTNESVQPRQVVDDAALQAKAQVIKKELAQIYSLVNHLQIKQVKVGTLLDTPRLGRENRQMLARTRTTIQNQLANLAKRHSEQSQALQKLSQAAPASAWPKQPSKPKQTVSSLDELMNLNTNTTSNDLSVATAQFFDDPREKTEAGLITKDDIFFDFPTPP